MRLPELAMLYGVVGLGCFGAALFVGQARGRSAGEYLLLLLVWPLYGPFLLLQSVPSGGGPRALRASMLALDPETAELVGTRLGQVHGRMAEIDRLLTRPDFSEEAALSRHSELFERGDDRAAAAAWRRVESIRKLQRIRDRFASDLVEIEELLAQLRIQSEVVRYSGGSNGGTRELVDELLSRVEGLDAVLEDGLEAEVDSARS